MYLIEINQVKPEILSRTLVGLLYCYLTRNLCLSGMEVPRWYLMFTQGMQTGSVCVGVYLLWWFWSLWGLVWFMSRAWTTAENKGGLILGCFSGAAEDLDFSLWIYGQFGWKWKLSSFFSFFFLFFFFKGSPEFFCKLFRGLHYAILTVSCCVRNYLKHSIKVIPVSK